VAEYLRQDTQLDHRRKSWRALTQLLLILPVSQLQTQQVMALQI